jgi:nucleotide-binding universal stress UspA family protein
MNCEDKYFRDKLRRIDMFKKIMVCLDGSELAEQIIPFGVSIARMNDAEIILFRAVSESSTLSLNIPGSTSVPVTTTNIEAKLKKDLEEAKDYLNTMVKSLEEETDLNVQAVTDLGVAGDSIVGYASENFVDLITISTHGRSGLERATFGSTADYVLRNTGLPNLIVRPKSEIQRKSRDKYNHLFQRILVCLDGSHLSEQILPYAVSQAKLSNGKLLLLRVIDAPDSKIDVNLTATVPVAEKENEYFQNEEDEANKYLDNFADSFQKAGLDAEKIVMHGKKAGEAIVDFAHNNAISLITMSTHGQGGWKRARFGSVADHVIRKSRLPILVIKPKEPIK